MKNLRQLISIVVLGLLCLGYAVSQIAALSGWAPDYAIKVDSPQVKWLSLCILFVCIVFAFKRDEEADGK